MIHRKDSPNGKRYARKDRAGTVEEAFGISLAPLLARGAGPSRAASCRRTHAIEDREREAPPCRRDIRKILTAAMEEGASGDRGKFEVGSFPRSRRLEPPRRWKTSWTNCRCFAKNYSTRWKLSYFRRIPAPMMTHAVSTYRIQIPNPSMNLNLALKKSRGQNRAKPSGR